MLFFRGLKPAACWMFFLVGTLGFAQWGSASQLAATDSKGSVAGPRIELDAQELKWIAEHSKVIVASVQYPLYLFKDCLLYTSPSPRD